MDFPILKKIPLFYGVKPEEIPSILHCLSGQIRSFSKGEMIFCAGESITSVGIVLEGLFILKLTISGAVKIS